MKWNMIYGFLSGILFSIRDFVSIGVFDSFVLILREKMTIWYDEYDL